MVPACDGRCALSPALHPESARLSAWAQSAVRRAFDVFLVLAILPALLPLCLLVAITVRCSSQGPILFLQQRVGRRGSRFTILKFRTMRVPRGPRRSSIATLHHPEITRIGRVLRLWKLDELPQFINVLRGDMSLIGPRPRVPEQQVGSLSCRPGITGPAALLFAQEELLLATLPAHTIEEYCRTVLLPLKHQLDASYMARATPLSDLRLLVRTALRRWPRQHPPLPATPYEAVTHFESVLESALEPRFGSPL